MLNRQEVKEELNRRLEEVNWFRDVELSSPDLARNFFSRIADYQNYVNTNKTLSNYLKKLDKQRKELSIDKDLVAEGDKMILQLNKEFKKLKRDLTRKNIVILSYEQIFPTGSGAISPSPLQALSMNVMQLEGFLNNKNQYVGDIPKNFIEMDFAFESAKSLGVAITNKESRFKKYYAELNSYKAKLRLQKITISFLRFDDYELLQDIWKSYYSTEKINFSRLSFFLGNLLNHENMSTNINSEEKRILAEFKPEYLLHIQRFHNYLRDQLEKRNWIEEMIYWLWQNLGPTLITLILIIIVFSIFKLLRFSAPIDLIIKLLK